MAARSAGAATTSRMTPPTSVNASCEVRCCSAAGQSVGMVAARICGWRARSRAVAWSSVSPGLRRSMMFSHHVERPSRKLSLPRTSGSAPIGIATSSARPTSGPKKPVGRTPTIVKGTVRR